MIVGFVLLIVGIIVISNFLARKRTEALKLTAQQLGFIFCGTGPTRPDYQIEMALFNRGRSRSTKNLMVGKWGGFDLKVLDYSYVTGGGKNSHTWSQTVAVFTTKRNFPTFEMRPEGILERIGDFFTGGDIDFESHPDFSRRFVLRGAMPEKVRKLFSPALLTFCEGLPSEKWHAEGCASELIFYRSDQSVDPDQIEAFLDKTAGFAKGFVDCCGVVKSDAIG